MAKWQYKPQPEDITEQGITQHDQFDNDDQGISEVLVREHGQNALDASLGQVSIEYRNVTPHDGLTTSFLEKLFDGHLIHARAQECKLDVDKAAFSAPEGISIEEFGTEGLSGPLVSQTREKHAHWSNFWFVHGKPTKVGKARGRWGLGKLVYSRSSILGAFFALTVRKNDIPDHGDAPMYFMGQSTLQPHYLHDADGNERLFPAHTWFADREGEHQTKIVPLQDREFIDEAAKNFGFRRKGRESGLSIFIPFPIDNLSWEKMISEAIISFFFPIITGQMRFSFDSEVIDNTRLIAMTEKYASKSIPDAKELFDFCGNAWEIVHGTSSAPVIPVKSEWWKDKILDTHDFSDEDIEIAREQFKKGKIVAVKLPMSLTHRERGSVESHFHIFVQKPAQLDQGRDLYIRKGLLIPKEAKFNHRTALGLLIVEEDVMSEFVGDCENAAHTKLNAHDRVKKLWVNPIPARDALRTSLVNFLDLLSESVEEEDQQALVNFFWTPSKSRTKSKKKSNKRDKKDLPNNKSPYQIRSLKPTASGAGIRITSSRDNQPIVGSIVKLQLGYEISRGDPFKRWNAADFDLSPSMPDISIETSYVTIVSAVGNSLEFRVDSPKFMISLRGFAHNRDLRVRCV